MGEARFFHLTRSTPEQVVRENAARAIAMGWKVLVRGRDPQALARLDDALWLHPDDSFLPHALSGGPHDAEQPLLLTTGAEVPNSARAIFSLDGADITPEEVEAFERVWIVFSGEDPQALDTARAQWRLLTAAGSTAEYWSEASGRWQMQTTTRKS